MGFSCGIIGLPNVGKSTIFNALTSAKAQAANFPFCTIEPNTGAVAVPDPRLDALSELAKSVKIIPTQVTFVDIAGLIKGASQGQGLGNQFLGHIRNVDAVAQVVRCFDDEDIVHVEGHVDPLRDIQTIETELLLADLENIQKQILRIERAAKSGDKELAERLHYLRSLEAHVSKEHPARSFKSSGVDFPDLMAPLLSSKPCLYVANVAEHDISAVPGSGQCKYLDQVFKHAQKSAAKLVILSGKLEAEIAELEPTERYEYLKSLELQESGLDRLVLAGYSLLDLITFFTVGPKETHAWTVVRGTKAPQGAGKIHSDFEKGFIRAEVIGYKDYINCGGETKARELGKLRIEGKDYVLQDGDVVHFRFNV